MGNIAGLGFTYLMQYLITLDPGDGQATDKPWYLRRPCTPAAYLLVGVVGFSAAVIMCFQGRYKRLEAEGAMGVAAAAAEEEGVLGANKGHGSHAGTSSADQRGQKEARACGDVQRGPA